MRRGQRSRGGPPKRGPGRPRRTDSPDRLVVRVPGTLKRWLRYQALNENRDMGAIVSDALRAYRQRAAGGRRVR